jgi:chromosome segregation ATPase
MVCWGEEMAQLDYIEQVDRELETFRARSQDTLKGFDQLEELISQFAKTRESYEAEVVNAAEIAELFRENLNEIEHSWLQLKSEVDKVLELLNRSEIEKEGRWVKYEKENKKAYEEFIASWQAFLAQYDSLASRLDDLQNAFEQRSALVDEGLTKMKNSLISADRNLRTQLEEMIANLRGDSEHHRQEVDRSLDSQSARLDDLQNAFEQRSALVDEGLTKMKNGLISADRNLRTQLEEMIAELRDNSEERWTKLQEEDDSMRKEFQASHGDLRTASWKMADDLRSEAEGGLSETNRSLTRQAARVEEINESLNRLEGELEKSRQEHMDGLSRIEQSNLVINKRISRQQSLIWAMLATIAIATIIIKFITYR